MFDALIGYAAAIALLTYVSVWTRLGYRVPGWVYALFAVLGLTVIVMWDGVLVAALSAAASVLLFVVLVGVAASRVSGVAVFTLSAAVATLPWWDWWSLVAGLGAALAVSLLHIRRRWGAGRATFVTLETMQAFGVTPTGGVMKPDLDRIPVPTKDETVEPSADSDDDVAREMPEQAQIRTQEFLLAGVLVAAVVAAVRAVG